MNAHDTAGRVLETGIDIDASIDDVWKALTEAQGLMNWFPIEARVTPGEGGSIWISWGEGIAWETRIAAWSPPNHLRLIYAEATPEDELDAARDAGTALPHPIAVDYHLEARSGSTTLRLVHSGFGEGDGWDAQYDGTVRGWAFELRGLRHYLERHPHGTRTVVHAKRALDETPLDEAWTRLFGSRGLAASGSIDDASAGDRCELTTVHGDELHGPIHIIDPPKDLCVAVEGFNDAFLRIRIDEGCMTVPNSEANVWLSTYGLEARETDALSARWREMLDEILA